MFDILADIITQASLVLSTVTIAAACLVTTRRVGGLLFFSVAGTRIGGSVYRRASTAR